MKKFLKWFNHDSKSLSALERSAITHSYFVSIHPFEDGNGRISRALAQKALFQSESHALFYLFQKLFITTKKFIIKNFKIYH